MGMLVISKRNQTLGKSNKIIGCEMQIVLREEKHYVWVMPAEETHSKKEFVWNKDFEKCESR